ncbi:hypothetical protein LAZ67_16002183, partial [Cordylochernes scorpioides]
MWRLQETECRYRHRPISKTTRHTRTPLQSFSPPDGRFSHVHIDLVGALPPSENYRYIFTCVDRFIRWYEGLLIQDITAKTVANAFLSVWISRFGVPEKVTTDQGRHFESALFGELTRLLGSYRIRISPYHPSANGLVEIFHRQLKDSLSCHDSTSWSLKLPLVLLGIRSSLREGLNTTTAELVYGKPLPLPGTFFEDPPSASSPTEPWLEDFKRAMASLKPAPSRPHVNRHVYVPKPLETCSHVYLRRDLILLPLAPSYDDKQNLSPKEQEELKQSLIKYADLFSPRLGRTNFAKHRIDTEDAKPIKHKPYRVSPKERDIIKDQIDEMLKEGINRPSSSPWSFPVILVKKRDGRLARWALKIQEYDFDIIHKSGKKHLDYDGLSRGPLPETDWVEDYDRLFLNQIINEENEFIENVKKSLKGSKRAITQNFKEENGCLYKKNPNHEGRAWLLVVPRKRRKEIMSEFHNHMLNGHLGVDRTTYRLKNKYHWPSMLKDVSEFVKTCHLCQSRKGSNQSPSELLQPIPPANYPFERIGIDFVGLLPSTKRRRKWIIVLTDYYTRYTGTKAVSEATVKEVSTFLIEHIVLRHGPQGGLIISFEDAFRGVFGLQEDSARRAEEVLKSRAQKAEESSESFIQEILSLCHQVNPRKEEGELVAHIIKGISKDTYQVLVAKDIQTVDEILKFCRHLKTVKQRRIGRTKFARLSNVMPISCVDNSDDLAGLIRRIVREEIQKVFSAPEVINPLREVNALEQTVREEVSRALQPTRPQVNVVQQQPRTPYYNIDRPTQPRKSEHWRTYDDKPICFHCGRPGHVVRYCRERRQVFAEARTRNGGEGKNVGFSSRPPRYDADDDYVTPQSSTLIESSDKLQETQLKLREWSQKINLTLDPGLSEIQRLQLVSCLDEFIDIFDFGSTSIKPTSTVKHKIKTGDHSPIKQRPYRVAPSERRLIQDEVNKMIENHIVKPSESTWSSPVILVRKKDGTWRFCVDYRRLKRITKKDVYPLPRIDDALDSLAGSSYFSTMDLRSGYWQIEVDEKDREKTAFITPDGLYEFQVMPFGLCNAPATFERMIDSVLGSLKWNMCLCYLDDIVVYAPTFEEHLRRLQLVLSCIQKAGLSLNHKKCLFGSRRITILGHLVDANGIHPDPDKVEAVSKFPRPRNISELRSFLGLCSYYRRFIENFADKARSLHDLPKTVKQFYWDAAQEKAFEVLKTVPISEPVLGHFDESADTHLHTGASGHGIGAVLLQIQGGKERPIAYASRSLTKAENNYSTTEKECLAVVWSISKFRPYLFGRPFTVTIILYVGWSPLENDPPSAVMSLTNVDIEQTKDPDLAKIIDNLNSGYTRKEFSIIDGILYKKNYSTTGRPWLMMIPKHLRSEVMADLHDAPTAGHLGFARTYDKVKKRFYWPGLYRTVRQYVSHCRECQRRKKLPRRSAGQLVSIPPVEKPFYKVGVDLLGRFPVSKDGNRWIIVCTDYMTRYAITKAIPDGGTIETAKFLVEDVILKHGAPREMITDRGRNFISQVIKEINALCGIVHRFTTAYHPQTNGLTERFNKTLGDMLSMYTGVEQKDWDQVLPYVTFAYNTAKQEATGYTPFFLVHAREAETYIDAVLPYLPYEISDDYVGELVTRTEEARQLSRSRLLQSQAKDRRLYDQKHTPVYYQRDDLVWVFTPIRKVGLSEKLLKRYFGPYKVTKKLSEVTYEVEPVDPSPRSRKSKDIVHVIRMKPYLDPEEQHSILLGNTGQDSVELKEMTVNIEEATQVGNYFVQHLPRNPSMFSVEDGEDPLTWLKGYKRVAKHNHWDETLCLANVYFYLNGTALKWFENNEETIRNWEEFTTQLESVFGKSESLRLLAEKKLKIRAQLKGESTEFYIQDVLRLCKEVDLQMSEGDKISHLMKGIVEELYQALLPRDINNTDQFVSECRRIEALHRRRVTPAKYERLPNVASLDVCDDNTDLSSMIRQIVREEVQRALAAPREEPRIATIEDMVREEIDKTLAPISNPSRGSPQYQTYTPSPIARRETAAPQTPRPRARYPKQGERLDTNEWRTTEGRPICFHCGRPGHVARYCRDRRRQNDERENGYSQRRQEPMFFYGPRSKFPALNDDEPRDNFRRYRSPSPYPGRNGQHSSPIRGSKGNITSALVDSGASYSVVSERFRLKLKKIMFAETDVSLRVANGKIIKPKGRCSLKLDLNGLQENFEFIVLEDCSHDVILGWDFLKLSRAVIDSAEDTLFLEEFLVEDTPKNNSPLYAEREYRIEPASCQLIEVLSRDISDNAAVVAESQKGLSLERELMAPSSIISLTSNRGKLWVANWSPYPKIIPQGMHVADGVVIEDSQLCVLAEGNHVGTDIGHSEDSKFAEILNIDDSLDDFQKEKLRNLLRNYRDIFDFRKKEASKTDNVKHRISTGDHLPTKQRPYRVAPAERQIIQEEVNKMEEIGIIQPSASPWASPVVLVRKKDGSWRFCVDYRRLNKITKKDVYPLPRIDDTLDCLQGARFYSSMDLQSGYWQIDVEEADREKTAFITPDGLYEFKVMPFGLCNAPATFERMMDGLLKGLKWTICLCYLDDIVVFSDDFEEHLRRLQLVLGCLRKAGLCLNSGKCRFGAKTITVLGHEVSGDGICLDPEKIRAVRDFPRPNSLKEVRSFLGLSSYYRRFIPNYAHIAQPLNALLKKDSVFSWNIEERHAFEALKSALISEPVLGHFDHSSPTEIHTDASNYGIGAVLAQIQKGKERAIAYASRTLNKAERNYSTTERECLAIIWAIGKFRPYVFGRPFTIVTDHHSLCWLTNLKDPCGRLARWALRLQEFDVTVVHKSGRKHQDADCLSRSPLNCSEDIEEDIPCIVGLQNFGREQMKDPDLTKIADKIQQETSNKSFIKINDTLHKKNNDPMGREWLLVVPRHLRPEILRNLHDSPTSGHLGFTKTYDRIRKKFYWPGMYRNVRKYVAHCPDCQRRKRQPQLPPGLLQPIPVPIAAFEKVGMDLLGRFPTSMCGNRWIIVCTDYLTKLAITKALPTSESVEVATFFIKDVILMHGAPREVITDRGRNFTSSMIRDLNKHCRITHRTTTAYHPQTNGLTERLNKTIADMLSMYVDVNQKDWDEILPFVTFAYNTAKQESTGFSPFYLVHGREADTPLDLLFPKFPSEDEDDFIQTLGSRAEEARQLARIHTMRSQGGNKLRYDAHHRNIIYQPGVLVWIYIPVRKVGLSEKLMRRYFGPYKVTRKISDVTYEVETFGDQHGRRKTKDIVHICRMKPYLDPEKREDHLEEDMEDDLSSPQKEEVPAEGRQPPLAQEEVPRPGVLDIPGPITRSRARRLEAQGLYWCRQPREDSATGGLREFFPTEWAGLGVGWRCPPQDQDGVAGRRSRGAVRQAAQPALSVQEQGRHLRSPRQSSEASGREPASLAAAGTCCRLEDAETSDWQDGEFGGSAQECWTRIPKDSAASFSSVRARHQEPAMSSTSGYGPAKSSPWRRREERPGPLQAGKLKLARDVKQADATLGDWASQNAPKWPRDSARTPHEARLQPADGGF